MKRRRFLEILAGTAGSLAAGAHLRPSGATGGSLQTDQHTQGPTAAKEATETPGQPAGKRQYPDLVVSRTYTKEALTEALARLGGIGRFVTPSGVVLIKPNVGFDSPPEWGATTDPRLVAWVAELCLEAGARRVIVADHTLREARRCFQRTGIAEAVSGIRGVKVLSLDREAMYESRTIEGASSLTETKLAKILAKADTFINLPTAKSHSATGVSFGLKNAMGLIWDRQVLHTKMDIHAGIADLARVVRPDLTILDAATALVTGGPSGPGRTVKLNTIVLGTDPVAVDALATGLAPWNGSGLAADQVAHLKLAAAAGLGKIDIEALRTEEI